MSDIPQKKFWCNICSIWTQLCIILWWILAQNIQNDVFYSHLQPFEACESCLFAISNHESCLLMPDISQDKNLMQYIQHLHTVMHHFIMDFGLKYPKWCVRFTSADRLKRGKAVYLQFLTTDSCLLMSDISQRKFWCNISSIWIQICLIIMMDFGAK